ncbi:MAG: NAD-glutamate dehydrogenase [Hyphomicrobiales bacterium]|nr:NAD-glutamate dehydrogenase [Hyphomicrobiales bacterium]
MTGSTGTGDTPAGFASALFGESAREDLAQYSPHALATLAAAAWQHLAEPRQPGQVSLRIIDPDAADLATVTVLEVVNDDMPFLLDSTLAELGHQGYELRLVAHPIVDLTRAADGTLLSLATEPGAGTTRESLIHVHVTRLGDEARKARLAEELGRVYDAVRLAFTDWAAMRERVASAARTYRNSPPNLPVDELAEAVEFLDWVAADNFTFLGVREYRLEEIGSVSAPDFDAVGGSGLGILRDPDVKVLRRGRELVTITPEVLEFLREPHALIIAKANVRSRIHRRVHMDYIGIKQFDADGGLCGELRLVGLFTSTAYTHSTTTIPYIRHKVARVLDAAHFDAQSHSGKMLASVLETFPRDELFQIDIPTLSEFAREIALLADRPRLRALARLDRFDRFVSILAYLPRDRYDSQVRRKAEAWLAEIYRGRVSAVYPFYPEGPLVRIHFIIGRDGEKTPVIPRDQLEAGLAALSRTWNDALREALLTRGDQGATLATAYGDAFSADYMARYGALQAMSDIGILEQLTGESPYAFVIGPPHDEATRSSLRVFSLGRPVPLSARVPALENLGFRVVSEQTADIRTAKGDVWLHDMALDHAADASVIAERGIGIESLLRAIARRDVQSDGFNALVINPGFLWRDIALMRALARYLRQTGLAFSLSYLWQALTRNPEIADALLRLVYARLDPDLDIDRARREAREIEIVAQIEGKLTAVTSLDEDRILRRFLNVIRAAVRTNYFQMTNDGGPRETISFKFESCRIDELPLPRPLYEITVYSPRVEGIHLRFGKVARGGLRWSDRPQDFRTEVLGLVKAQQVKNAVIVPVGAKGGFVPKRLPPASDREAFMAEGVAAYEIFIRALLELTDNLVEGKIAPPQDTLRHDGEDPYLVVAADKGTATFSDIANCISLERGHWLGDAFASGGSAGFDHKKMGITARGAWEAVKRHFREIDTDIQTVPFTVAGVGDMSGDVFGNGMLLSPEIRLVAAFDHRDIFLDPHPQAEKALAERARLFALPRSSWQDYDAGLISKGGGVFARSAKQIPLSPELRALLGLDQVQATPHEVIRAILRAKVDLLWFGGIGTYVRATQESDEQAGDRSNDAVRITAADLRCKVIGEGANLGLTQRGRIEAAMAGVRLNSDAIDNSAGVNTSDIEVNIKIALSVPMGDGRLDLEGRNALLASMTDDIAALVLRNNYSQPLALSLSQRRGPEETGFAIRLMQSLEKHGRLDRAVEFLPDDASLVARARSGLGLTRPELSVLLAYAKLATHEALLESDVPDDPFLSRELVRYFPAAMVERFTDAIQSHRLRREIVVTALANALIDRGGPTIVSRLADETGADAPLVARAFLVLREAYGLGELETAIDALDNHVPGLLQLDLYGRLQDLLIARLPWFVRNADLSAGIAAAGDRFRTAIESLTGSIGTDLPPTQRAANEDQEREWQRAGVPADLARRLAILPALVAAPDIVLVAERSKRPLAEVAATFFAVDETYELGALVSGARTLNAADPFDRIARDRALAQIDSARSRLTATILAGSAKLSGTAAVNAWLAAHGPEPLRARALLNEIAGGDLSLARLTVAAGLLGDLLRS